MGKALEKLKEEFLAIIPPTIFFFVALHIVAFVRVLITRGTGITPASTISIAIAALILGKAVLIATCFRSSTVIRDRPLIYNVVVEDDGLPHGSPIVIHYLERLIDFWRAAGGFVAGNEKLLAEMIWPPFWAIRSCLLVLIVDVLHDREPCAYWTAKPSLPTCCDSGCPRTGHRNSGAASRT